MKKIATILIFIFSCVQVAPAICAMCTAEQGIFMPDEEKGNGECQVKLVKDYSLNSFEGYQHIIDGRVNTAFHLSEKIHHSPYLEQHTPPPDFL